MRILLFIFVLTIYSNGFSQSPETKFENCLRGYLSAKSMNKDSLSRTIDIHLGTISIPNSFSNKRTGTIDSEKGELANGEFIIYYDIGLMSGAHMNETLKKSTYFYTDAIYKNRRTVIGLQKQQNETELVITILGDYTKNMRFPANFWATVKSENEIQTMLDIALSYVANK